MNNSNASSNNLPHDNTTTDEYCSSDTSNYTSLVHDNEITAYHVDISKGILLIETIYYEKEATTIEFSGVLAHKFDHVIKSNLIFGIYQESIPDFIKRNYELLEQSMKYGFPLTSVNNIDVLEKEIEKSSYNCYMIDSSIGLNGFVIAKNIEINVTQKESPHA